MPDEKNVALLHSPGSNDQQPMPPTSANPPTRGVSGMVCFVSTVAWRGPRSITFSRVVLGDALVGERHDAEHEERDAENRCCLHGHVLSRGVTQPASSARRQSRATEQGRRARARRVVTTRSARQLADQPSRPVRARMTRIRKIKLNPHLGNISSSRCAARWAVRQRATTPAGRLQWGSSRVSFFRAFSLLPINCDDALRRHALFSPDSRSRSRCMAARPASTASVRTALFSWTNSRPLSTAWSMTWVALLTSS